MSVPNTLIAWAERFASTSYVLRVVANATTTDLAFPASGSLTVGRNYWMVDDSQADAAGSGNINGVGSLCTLLENCLIAHSQIATAVVTIDQTTPTEWTLKIVCDVAVQILWAHANTTLDKTLFGFTGSTSSATTLYGTLPPGLWAPRLARTTDTRKRTGRVARTTRALSGRTRTAQLSTGADERTLTFQYVPKEFALIEYSDSTEPSNNFESLQDAMLIGRPVRVYEDDSIRNSAAYQLFVSRDGADTLESMSAQNLVWWQCSLPLVELT